MKECFFFPFSRLLVKDEIKKGSFEMTAFLSGAYTSLLGASTVYDAGAQTDYKVNSPAGEYGLLYTNSAGTGDPIGHVYYQAGISVLTASIFKLLAQPAGFNAAGETVDAVLSGSLITVSTDGFRHRLKNVQFNNTTELNSSIYFCRAGSNEFNYSSNSTYLSGSQVVIKNARTDTPASYVTSIGLYSSDNVLLATAKLSEPLKKDPTNELTLRVRLDY